MTGDEFKVGDKCVYCDSGYRLPVEVLSAEIREGKIFYKLQNTATQEVFDVSKLLNCGMADSLGWYLSPLNERRVQA